MRIAVAEHLTRVARHEQHLDLGPFSAEPPGEFLPSQLWHDDVGHQQVDDPVAMIRGSLPAAPLSRPANRARCYT
jgi:hypothetical protein